MELFSIKIRCTFQLVSTNIPKENKNKMMNLFIFDKVLEG